MMRLADRYITMEFLRALLFALLAFLALFTLLEALNLSKLESDKPRRHMYLYLVYAQPQVFQKVLPMALTFAVCFVTAQFSASRELVALYSAGRSFYRVMAPIYSSALLCAVVIFVFSNFITPPHAAGQSGTGPVAQGRAQNPCAGDGISEEPAWPQRLLFLVLLRS
ncbi:MAG: LptF/LptG family permease [Candidatus Competibacteraceae bacterium]|nr:LptF/LptG family permease [Candidatus Competibacteraceae bacterium]